LLIEAKDLSQRLNTVRIPLELALIKYAQPISVDNSSKSDPIAKPKTIDNEKLKVNIDMSDFDIEEDDVDQQESKQDVKNEFSGDTEDDSPSDDTVLGQLKNRWEEIIFSMQKKRAALASHLSFAQPVSSRGSLITIAFSSRDHFHKECVESDKNLKFIEDAISKFINIAIGIKFALQDLPDGHSPVAFSGSNDNKVEKIDKTEDTSKREKTKDESVEDDTFLNELLDTFGGKFHNDE